MNTKKIYITILENPTGVSGLAVGTSLSIRGVGASIGFAKAGCTSFLSSVATLTTDAYCSNLN